jgi:hypothetical protein
MDALINSVFGQASPEPFPQQQMGSALSEQQYLAGLRNMNLNSIGAPRQMLASDIYRTPGRVLDKDWQQIRRVATDSDLGV